MREEGTRKGRAPTVLETRFITKARASEHNVQYCLRNESFESLSTGVVACGRVCRNQIR